MPKRLFDHERLRVYRDSIKFIGWLTDLLETIPKTFSVYDQLDRASTSIPLNLAEGNGKFTPRDRCRYFDIARGSALECAAALDVATAKRLVQAEQVEAGKELLLDIVSMLVGLTKAIAPERVFEEPGPYDAGGEE